METITAVVSIGRGAHARQEPLDRDDWYAFQREVAGLLTVVADGILHVDAAASTGEWNGQPEDSATFVAEVPVQTQTLIRHGLRWLAKVHGQEAIALTFGDTEFVTP
jgi:hypothetical protein